MYILIATVCIFALVLIAFIAFSKDEKVSDDRAVNRNDYSKGIRFKNSDDMQQQFKDVYLWTCDVFGVNYNMYDDLEDKLKTCSSLGIGYCTYYRLSDYPSLYHPNGLVTNYKIYDWRNVDQQTKFAKEFIENINSIRYNLDADEIKLFKKYKVSYKRLLTNKFEVNNMKLFSLPE